MILIQGDYVELYDKAVFYIIYVHKEGTSGMLYPFEGKCVSVGEDSIWRIGEPASWSKGGHYDEQSSESCLNINKVLTKEKYPEYYL